LVLSETDDFLVEMDEDVEGLQSTIYLLQQQLKDAREQLSTAQAEIVSLRSSEQDSASSDPSKMTVSENSVGHEPLSLIEEVRTPGAPSSIEAGADDDEDEGRTEDETHPSGRCESPAPSTCHDTVSTTNGCTNMDTSGPASSEGQEDSQSNHRTPKCPPPKQQLQPQQPEDCSSDAWSSPTSMDVDEKVYRTPETAGLQNGLVTSATDP
jgi:hypothetical protein